MFRGALVLFVGGGTLTACAAEEGAIPAVVDEIAEIPCDNAIEGLGYQITRDGVREAFLHAETACLWHNSDTLVVTDFRLVIYEEVTGVEQASVTGEDGVLNSRSRRMRANGDAVLLIPSQGRRIESAELIYDPQTNQIRSDSATTMYVEDRVVRGTGFESDLGFTNVRVRGLSTESGEGAR